MYLWQERNLFLNDGHLNCDWCTVGLYYYWWFLVKKLTDTSNVPQNSKVYAPGASYRQVPNESLNDLNSECDYATEHIYESVT